MKFSMTGGKKYYILIQITT